jgi:ribonuclease P protein component
VERLLKRRDFLRVQKGRRANTGLFSVLALPKPEGASRIGFTVSKKVYASAVKRNRIRRRLKEAARLEAAAFAGSAADIVVIAKPEALRADFALIRSGLRTAVAKAMQERSAAAPTGPRRND